MNTYFVDQNNPIASDANVGTAQQPWKTIGQAAKTLQVGDTVFVKSGVYRESLSVTSSGQPGADINFVAHPGDSDVVISGADIIWGPGIDNAPGDKVTHWVPVAGSSGVFHAQGWAYTYDDPDGKIPESHQEYLIPQMESGLLPATLTPEERERGRKIIERWAATYLNERQAFVNTQPLDQVYSLNQMTKGTYYVNDTDNNLFIRKSDDSQPVASDKIEVARRPRLLFASGNYIKFEGFIMRWAASNPRLHAVHFKGNHCHLVNNTIVRMGGIGVTLEGRYHELSGNTINENGNLGIAGPFTTNINLNGNTTNKNSWKWTPIFNEYDDPAVNFPGISPESWENGGIKAAGVKNWKVVNHNAMENIGNGVWFDHGDHNQILDSTISNNRRTGIRIELSHFTEVGRNDVIDNDLAGVGIQADHCSVYKNTIVNNKHFSGVSIFATYLDSIAGLAEEEQLDKGFISQDLQDALKDKEIVLGVNAVVSVKELGSIWRITDPGPPKPQEYIMAKLGSALNLYRNIAEGVTVFNNTIVSHIEGISAYTPAKSEIKNNIIKGCSTAGIRILHAANQNVPTIDYNDFWENDSDISWREWSKDIDQPVKPDDVGSFNIYEDPLFLNEGVLNFDLQLVVSPCIDVGSNVGLPFHGKGPDMGAHETLPRFSVPNLPYFVAVDPLVQILAGSAYVRLTLPDPPPIEIITAQARELAKVMGPEEKSQALIRIKNFSAAAKVFERELSQG